MTDYLPVEINVNGERQRALIEPRKTLADFIRDDCGLTGTHLACEHGVCGACNVQVDGQVVRSCLMFAIQANGASVKTIESVADGSKLSAVQEAFRAEHGLQCGFCTPGFVMSVEAIVERGDDLSDEELARELSGNLCRCTGYQGIIAAARRALDQKKSQEAST